MCLATFISCKTEWNPSNIAKTVIDICIGPVTGHAGIFTTLPIPERFRADQMQSFADILNGRGDGMAATIKEGCHIQHALESIIKSAEEQKWLPV